MKLLMVLLFNAFAFSIAAQDASTQTDIQNDLRLFTSPMATALKKNARKSKIEKMKTPELKQIAQLMQKNEYDKTYRVASYSAWLTPTTLGKELLIGDGYSKYENMTGIWLPVGRHIVLVDNIAEGKKINLLVPNWNRHAPEGIKTTEDPAGWGIVKQEFPLHNGINILEIKSVDGLAYLDYYSDNPDKENPITVHFVGGRVNGYFDIAKNNDADWNALIDHAIYPIIDARGAHIQIAYPAADCKKYAYGKGVQLISNYDSLVYREQRLLGLVKYNKVPKNHILARVNYNYYMFRDGDGVAYMGTNPGNAMPLVVDPNRVIKGDPCWGFCHEVGHVHQVRPAFNWGGLGEVSNNIFSLYVTTSFGNKSRLAEQKTYLKARDSIITRHTSYLQNKDPFSKLVPFWQLQLYFSRTGNYPDFYPDLFETFRQQGAAIKSDKFPDNEGWGARGKNPAVYQLNFIKTACEVSKTDLIDFFEQYGFFYVGKFSYDDYGKYNYEMTQAMADECKNAVKAMNFPKPTTDITLLED